MSVKGVLGYFEDISATVELRGIISGDVVGHLESAAPFIGLEPVASIRLSLDSGFPSELLFQIGKSDLQRLIASLLSLSGRMDELSAYVGGSRD
jgi:hypothetical protein